MLTVAVLDVVELRREGVPIAVRPGKTTEVLVRLAMDAGTRVRTDQLIADLWAGHATATARNTLQTKISRLRRALGDASLVSASPDGYTLRLEPEAVDALRVDGLAAKAAAERAAGKDAAAHATCTAALAMFGVDVLRGAGDGDWLVPHRVHLEELRLTLLEIDMSARMDLGDSSVVVGELEMLVRHHPLAESLWSLLMLALYRAGRQADALAAYRRARSLLAEELGLEPGGLLRAMEQRVLVQDPRLQPRSASRPTEPTPARGNLPALSSETVGRAAHTAVVQAAIAVHRLVTIVGTAGVGKTRLALDAVRGVPRADGSWLIRLDAATDTRTVREALASALGVTMTTEDAVSHHLRGSDALLVMDSCEHVLEGVVTCLTDLLRAAPHVTVLCTSQVPLGVEGEVVHPLEPLSLENSIALFARLARQKRPAFVLDGESASTVTEVCRSLDGLPLAIELAAARAKTLPIEEIARRLTDRFALLSDPTSTQPLRRRALGAAIGWSYDLLFPDDQRGLWAAACFTGAAPLSGLEQVLAALGAPEGTGIDVVARLASRSLLDVEARDGRVGYRLLDSVRAYALDRLVESGSEQDARKAHGAFIAGRADQAARELRGPRQADHLRFVQDHQADVDTALQWAAGHDPDLGLRVACGFGWAWFVLGARPRGTERLRAALDAARGSADRRLEVSALCLLAWMENHDVTRAAADAGQALALAGEDEHLRATSRTALAFVLLQQAQPQEALQILAGVVETQRATGHDWDAAAAAILSVHAALLVGDTHTAGDACGAAEQLVRGLGDDWASGHLDGALGFLAQVERRYDEASVHLRRAAAAAERLGFPATHALHLGTLGRILQQAGDLSAAAEVLQRSVAIGIEIRDLRVVALGRVRLARVLRAQGEDAEAAQAAHAADHWFRMAGGGEGARLAACLAVTTDADAGGPLDAGRLQKVLHDAREHHDTEIEVLALDGLARASAAEGDRDAGCAYLLAADTLMPSVEHVLQDIDRLDAAHARAALV